MSDAQTATGGIQIEMEGKLRRIELTRGGGDRWSGTLDGDPIEIDARLAQPGVLSLIVQGRSYRCVLDAGPIESAIHVVGQRFLVSMEDPRSLTARTRKGGAAGGQQVIKAPMPGRIVRLLVQAGDEVAAQQGVVVIEAMKMQNELKAARAGRVAEVRAREGTTVAAGEALVVIG
jgi:biotin carboxyl carrier protein